MSIGKLKESVVVISRMYSGSNRHWIQRQLTDPYVQKAKLENYRCRSAFKLIHLNEMVSGGLFQPGNIVVDLGAAPGSWSQVAANCVNSHRSHLAMDQSPISVDDRKGLVIAFDRNIYADIPGVVCHSNIDLLKNWEQCIALIRQSVDKHLLLTENQSTNHGVDVVLSDMAPNATGLSDLDIPNIMELANCVLNIAINTSKPGASLVIKIWQNAQMEQFKQLVSKFYSVDTKVQNNRSFVRFMKPDASRLDSSEVYVVARGFKMPKHGLK